MNPTPEPVDPSADDFRALARSSPWRFTTLHFSHRSGRDGRQRAVVQAWLDRSAGRLTVRSADGVEVAAGAPYGSSGDAFDTGRGAAPELRPDGLVACRPLHWHLDHGDPMWRNYRWTAMLDPDELSSGVAIGEVTAVERRDRLTWSALCRPSTAEHTGQDGPENGDDPRCGCCPLLDSAASRLVEYGPDDPSLQAPGLPTTYRVQLDVQTGIVVGIDAIDGHAGVVCANEIHSVDAPLDPPTP